MATRRNSTRIAGLVLPLLALNVLIVPHLAAAQTSTHASVPAIMPTLAGPAKPRTTQWEELCTTKGLIAPWLSWTECTNSAMLAQLTKSDCSPYVTRTLDDTDPTAAAGVMTDCFCPAYQTIGVNCLQIVCPTEAASLFTKQLLEGVCPGVMATDNGSFPLQTRTTTAAVSAEATGAGASRGSGPEGAAGNLSISLGLSFAASLAGMMSALL
ncbi:hypothetical protein LX32DRAFT_644022 [Colletotrichum zoysiae]|uniref:CFEM domain-containing protein n=1 Tax=Colletotrichum zoysiae TaxID=1216348 RepID=A0AAD9H928_9PEZI|nr:hypothetical protein LX32DRAFT_644022 [Colletotrichum zoysiae]